MPFGVYAVIEVRQIRGTGHVHTDDVEIQHPSADTATDLQHPITRQLESDSCLQSVRLLPAGHSLCEF